MPAHTMVNMRKARVLACWLKGNCTFSCRSVSDPKSVHLRGEKGSASCGNWHQQEGFKGDPGMATAISGKNDSFLVVPGFQCWSSSDSPHLPSGARTRPWGKVQESSWTTAPLLLDTLPMMLPVQEPYWCRAISEALYLSQQEMGPKSQWIQCFGIFSSCAYCIKIPLLFLQWYIFAKQLWVSVSLLLKLKHRQVGKFASESQEIWFWGWHWQSSTGLLLCPSRSWVLWRKGGQRWRSPLCRPPGQGSILWHSLKNRRVNV